MTEHSSYNTKVLVCARAPCACWKVFVSLQVTNLIIYKQTFDISFLFNLHARIKVVSILPVFVWPELWSRQLAVARASRVRLDAWAAAFSAKALTPLCFCVKLTAPERRMRKGQGYLGYEVCHGSRKEAWVGKTRVLWKQSADAALLMKQKLMSILEFCWILEKWKNSQWLFLGVLSMGAYRSTQSTATIKVLSRSGVPCCKDFALESAPHLNLVMQ